MKSNSQADDPDGSNSHTQVGEGGIDAEECLDLALAQSAPAADEKGALFISSGNGRRLLAAGVGERELHAPVLRPALRCRVRCHRIGVTKPLR